MSEVLIRRAEPADIDALVKLTVAFQLHHEAANARVWRITEQGRRELREEAEKLLVNQAARIFVAERKGKIVGFISGEAQIRSNYLPERVGQISRLYVRKEYRRQGIGTELVKQFCEFLESNHVEEVTLNYILGNEEAESFWAKLGFQAIRISANQQLSKLRRALRS